MYYLGVDTGGTFTDFVLLKDGDIRIHKVLSTPHAPEEAILQGIREMAIPNQPILIVHGSTVATNAVLEGKGVKTAYVANTGFKDVLTIGRQARAELYNLQPENIDPPVPDSLCLEVDCRLSSKGQWLTELDEEKLNTLAKQLNALKPEAVAINLLFSWLDDSAEQAIKKSLPADLFVAISSEVLSEVGEYERGIATWLNAWVGPLIQGYINRLQSGLVNLFDGPRLSVMQSSGETMDAELAANQAVRMLLSGPAGGLVGAQFVAAQSGLTKLMTFDMGGTSSDVALIDGKVQLTNRGRIGRYPVAVPMVDMHTIGAGGGSIARLDQAGMLLVGPESAGASPGPACYDQGGVEATVTDANLVLGRIPSTSKLGGYLPLSVEKARQAVQKLADKMQMTLEEAARGIIKIANENMARALQVISVQKGYDPHEFTLVSFGGAGGLHVCDLAEKLHVKNVLVPVYAGVLSALGMLATRPGRQLSQSVIKPLTQFNDTQLLSIFDDLAEKAKQALLTEGHAAEHFTAAYSLDLRYQGQSNALNIEWKSLAQCQMDFHQLHEKRYGHRLEIDVELVNVRVAVLARGIEFSLAKTDEDDEFEESAGNAGDIKIFSRAKLKTGQCITGPAIITETVATTWLAEGWQCQVDEVGNLLLDRH